MKHLIRSAGAAAILLAASASVASASGNDFCGNGFSTCSTPTVYFDHGHNRLGFSGQSWGNFDFRFDLNSFFSHHRFSGFNGGTGNVCTPGIACVPPTTTVPEPITMTLLATGLVGMGGVGLIRRKKIV